MYGRLVQKLPEGNSSILHSNELHPLIHRDCLFLSPAFSAIFRPLGIGSPQRASSNGVGYANTKTTHEWDFG
jgi:hypothetical protein